MDWTFRAFERILGEDTHYARGLEGSCRGGEGKIFELMRSKNVVDTRNILDAERWKEDGFSVKVMGDGK